MIEAVENHMPETIVIDEIGTELEALAASTIAQRGVQLVGTAHGMTIDNIVKNPSLQLLVGGIEVFFLTLLQLPYMVSICMNYFIKKPFKAHVIIHQLLKRFVKHHFYIHNRFSDKYPRARGFFSCLNFLHYWYSKTLLP